MWVMWGVAGVLCGWDGLCVGRVESVAGWDIGGGEKSV